MCSESTRFNQNEQWGTTHERFSFIIQGHKNSLSPYHKNSCFKSTAAWLRIPRMNAKSKVVLCKPVSKD